VRAAFDAAADSYDRARSRLVPNLDAFYGAAVDAVPFGEDEEIRVLDLGAGTGLLSALLVERYPRAEITLADISVEMLRVARTRFGNGGPGRFQFRVLDFARKPLPGEPGEYDLIVSALAIHHLTHGDKRELFEKAYEVLAGGGHFVNADQVLGRTPDQDARNREWWLRSVREAGASERELAGALQRMKADMEAKLDEQMRWLEEAGFTGVRSEYEDHCFAVYTGRKRPLRV
jgi:tRNA (cmo5U34)-methyltransferase